MEYYQSRSDEKYKVYHVRMEQFLKKSAVDDILRGKSGELVTKREDAEKRLTHARTKSKSEVTKIISQTERRVSKQSQIVAKDLHLQEQRLEERIHKRRTMSNRSVNSDQDLENEEGANEKLFKRVGVHVESKAMALNPRRVFI